MRIAAQRLIKAKKPEIQTGKSKSQPKTDAAQLDLIEPVEEGDSEDTIIYTPPRNKTATAQAKRKAVFRIH